MAPQLRTSITLVSITALLVTVTLASIDAEAGRIQLPPGTYTATITESDIPPGFPPEAIPVLVGQWQIEFTEAGTLIVSKKGEGVVVVGRYTSNPVRYVTTDLLGPLACVDEPGEATGVYEWTFENNELTLTVVHDRCAGRAFALTVHPLQKQ
jgi:hypothetical protein